jgi:hypothetical protein
MQNPAGLPPGGVFSNRSSWGSSGESGTLRGPPLCRTASSQMQGVRAIPRFILGIRSFKSKEDARAEVRRVLHGAEIDQPLVGADLTLVASLYARHPRRSGSPDRFCVGINDYHGSKTRGFHAFYDDGRKETFSYLPCLSPQTDAPNLLNSMRAAIMPSQREALRNAYAGRVMLGCSFCGVGLELESAHVHHMAPKFRDIADAFVALVGVPPVITAELGDDFADPKIKRRWVLFHDAVAQRTVLCADCNAKDERKPAEG